MVIHCAVANAPYVLGDFVVRAGDPLYLLREHERAWYGECNGQVGHIPKQIIHNIRPVQPTSAFAAVAVYTFLPEGEGMEHVLPIFAGEELFILNCESDWWFGVIANERLEGKKSGYVPSTYLERRADTRKRKVVQDLRHATMRASAGRARSSGAKPRPKPSWERAGVNRKLGAAERRAEVAVRKATVLEQELKRRESEMKERQKVLEAKLRYLEERLSKDVVERDQPQRPSAAKAQSRKPSKPDVPIPSESNVPGSASAGRSTAQAAAAPVAITLEKTQSVVDAERRESSQSDSFDDDDDDWEEHGEENTAALPVKSKYDKKAKLVSKSPSMARRNKAASTRSRSRSPTSRRRSSDRGDASRGSLRKGVVPAAIQDDHCFDYEYCSKDSIARPSRAQGTWDDGDGLSSGDLAPESARKKKPAKFKRVTRMRPKSADYSPLRGTLDGGGEELALSDTWEEAAASTGDTRAVKSATSIPASETARAVSPVSPERDESVDLDDLLDEFDDLVELSEARGRNRKRAFSNLFDREGARVKFMQWKKLAEERGKNHYG